MAEAQRIRKRREEGCVETADDHLFRAPLERSIVAAILIARRRPPWVILDPRIRTALPIHFRFAPKADLRLINRHRSDWT